ncbi:hypothetical protein Taro_049704, partial [Colocasia esculenta]|nr:hypothetical protein [Colocasia esculenta]
SNRGSSRRQCRGGDVDGRAMVAPQRRCRRESNGAMNTLEQDEATASSALAITGEEEYSIPGGLRLVLEKKTPSAVRTQEIEEGRSSQGTTKAGNMVARLMGLDQMPDGQEAPRTSAGYYSREFKSPPPVRSHQQRKMHHGDASRRDTAVTPPPRRPLQPRNCNALAVEDGRHGTRSLLDTARVSSARRSWDTDPRLSL